MKLVVIIIPIIYFLNKENETFNLLLINKNNEKKTNKVSPLARVANADDHPGNNGSFDETEVN